MRRQFFGEAGSTLPIVQDLLRTVRGYRHLEIDMRSRQAIRDVFEASDRISSFIPPPNRLTTRLPPFPTMTLM
jgi:hypothetical protein